MWTIYEVIITYFRWWFVKDSAIITQIGKTIVKNQLNVEGSVLLLGGIKSYVHSAIFNILI